LDWFTVLVLGAGGGAIVQAVSFSANVHAWQAARHEARAASQPAGPRLTSFVDPLADGLVLLTRVGLGALAGALFHAQVSGATAAIAVGAAAPALLSQLGAARGVAVLGARDGTSAAAEASIQVASVESPVAKEG
jgi:hypothetical protein